MGWGTGISTTGGAGSTGAENSIEGSASPKVWDWDSLKTDLRMTLSPIKIRIPGHQSPQSIRKPIPIIQIAP